MRKKEDKTFNLNEVFEKTMRTFERECAKFEKTLRKQIKEELKNK